LAARGRSSAPGNRPSRRTGSAGSGRRKPRGQKSSDRVKRSTRRPSSDRPTAARRNGAGRLTPTRRRSAGSPLPENGGTSRRGSRRSAAFDIPWYFKLTRGQWIGIAACGGTLLLLLVLSAAWASSKPRRRRVRNRRPVAYGSGGNELLIQGVHLEEQGRKKEAIEAYRRAVDAANRKAKLARKRGDKDAERAADHIGQQANMRLYAIMKHSTLRGH